LTRTELLGFLTIAASALLLAALERRFPYNRGQRLFRDGFATDLLAYGLVQSYVLGVVIGRLLTALDGAAGLPGRRLLDGWPVLAQVSLFVATHDLYIYLFHRLQHASPLLFRIHEAHHATAQVDWLSGVRSHPLEILINQTFEFAPLVLLGASPEVPVVKGVISAVWGMFIHANLDVRLGSLQYVVNGPGMHRWHHATDPAAHGRNFSTKLAVWDWLLGTAYFPDPAETKVREYGLGGALFPRRYLAQVWHAFRREPSS
jgi:sterol desaturase/sphingolipid hydroxylase (fatty acid hydroxylase superfamily)